MGGLEENQFLHTYIYVMHRECKYLLYDILIIQDTKCISIYIYLNSIKIMYIHCSDIECVF